jgi:hypothetical protein
VGKRVHRRDKKGIREGLPEVIITSPPVVKPDIK